MILFINCYLTNGSIPPFASPQPIPFADKLAILKYQIGSYSRMQWDQVHIYVDMDEPYRKDMEEFDAQVKEWFPDATVYSHNRLTNINLWREALEFLKDLDPRTAVWFNCNHDHPIMAHDISLLYEIDRLFLESETPYNYCQISHWHEFLEHAVRFGWKPEGKGFVSFYEDTNWSQGVQVMTAEMLLCWYTHNNPNPSYYLPRPDWSINGATALIENPVRFKTYIPLQEMCRHFEGYAHIYTPFSEVPQLTVPSDFGVSAPPPFSEEEEHVIRIAHMKRRGLTCPEEFINWRQM